jgi:fumarate hydratase subunit alpha
VRISEGLTIPNGLEKAINAGIAEAVKEGYLRASVAHPLTRENTGTNTPAVIHYEIVPGDELFEIWVMPKGCGSENMSRLAMLKPADGIEGIKDFVLETVKLAGPNPCPPLIVGVGIGGSFEHCAFLAKKALFRELGTPNPDPKVKALEEELLSEINRLGIGPLGFGGKTTALAVHVEVAHTHIASLPVAVNFLCHSARIAKIKFL